MSRTLKDLVLQILENWKTGEINEIIAQEKAEKLCEEFMHYENLPYSNPEAIAYEILSQLEILSHQLIIKEDIPFMIDFLNTKAGEEKKAWESWQNYWDEIDISDRLDKLRDNNFYDKKNYNK